MLKTVGQSIMKFAGGKTPAMEKDRLAVLKEIPISVWCDSVSVCTILTDRSMTMIPVELLKKSCLKSVFSSQCL